jgi:hypothetical protein
MARAFRVAQVQDDFEAAATAAFPDPEPLIGAPDDMFDRSRWW